MPGEIFIVTATLTAIGLIVGICTGVFKVGAWVGDVNAHKSNVNTLMEEVRADVKRIFGILSKTPTVQSGSPLRLTPLGLDISKELDAASWAQEQAETLRSRVGGKSAGEIQEYCFTYLRDDSKRDVELNKKIADSAFQHGIDRQLVLDVLAIELRDVLLGDQAPTLEGPHA